MPPRPEGTDGSDWSYREVVEDRYKRMAVNMSATLVLHQVQTLIVVLKLAWTCIPIYTGEGTPNQFFYAWAVLLLLGNVCFYLGKPRGRCILPYMKVAVTCVLLTMALTFIGIWKMYMLEPKTSMLSRRLFKYLKDTGRVTSIKALDTFTTIEGLIDAATLAACGVCFFVFNNWVKDAMEVVKERDERNKAAGGGATAAKAAGLKKRR